MDAALYLSLREEIQQDAVRVERQLDDLRNAESFLLRRIHTAEQTGSYQVVLNDLATEIIQAESEHAELLHLSRFVTRCLLKAYAANPTSPRALPPTPPPTPSTKTATASDQSGSPESPDYVRQSTSKQGNQQKTNGPAVSATQGVAFPTTPPLRPGTTVEFDEQGFPILAEARPKPSPPSITTSSSQREPPTVLFGPDGFPLNPPAPNGDETINEPPQRPKPNR